MQVFADIKVDPNREFSSLDELWDAWEEETKAALGAMEEGKIAALYKVVGQRRVIAVFDVESHDELDQILMAGFPIAHHLEFEQVLPVREYAYLR